MRRPRLIAALRPAPEEELLLRLAFCEVRAARELCSRATTIAIDRLPVGSDAVLPHAYRRLVELGVEEQSLERLKGVYRSSWTRNQLLRVRLRAVLDALISVEVTPFLLGGMRLATNFYDELALRPVRHIELVVEAPEFQRAVGVLRRMDWSVITPVAPGTWPDQVAFGSHSDATCVLASELPRELRAARRGWANMARIRRVQEQFESRPIQVLDPLDELLLSASGRKKPSGVLQALVDAHTIITALGQALDWNDLASRAADRALSYRVLDVLSYLRATLRTPMPDNVLSDMAGTASTGRERVICALEAMEGGLLGGFPGTLAEFARTTEAASAPRAIPGLPRYLQHVWGVDRAGLVPVEMIKKGAARLRSRRRPAKAA